MVRKSSVNSTPSVKEALLLLKDASVAEIDHLINSLHQIKEAREHLESLFSGSVSAVKKVAETVVEEAGKVVRKKRGRKPGRKAMQAPALAEAPKAMKPAKVAKAGRKPGRKAGDGLGPARPGTLRDLVHASLKDLGPIKTNDLVKHLEQKLGPNAGKSLRVRVNQVLSNRRDSSIKKVSRGVYSFAG